MNWSYVAGFFDGEGTVSARSRKIAMFQKDPKVLLAIQEFLRTQGIEATMHHRAGGLSAVTDKHISRIRKGKPWAGHGNQYSKRPQWTHALNKR